MNKDQFKLQVYNNRYIRGVVVTICKIIIWTLIYALIVGVTLSVVAQDADTYAVANYYSNASSGPSAGVILGTLIFLVVTVVYYAAVIMEIVRKIKQNKQLTEYEEQYFEENKSTKDK